MPDKIWDDRKQQYVDARAIRTEAQRTDPMPEVSERFLEWVQRLPVPELTSFESMDPNAALKQVAYQAGIRFIKSKIAAEAKLNQARTRLGDIHT